MLRRRSYALHQRRVSWIGLSGGLLLLLLLVGCGGSQPVTTVTPTPTTAPSPMQMVSYDLHLPAVLLRSPVVRPLPDDTMLHVNFTFKANQQLLDQLNQQKHQQGQNTNLQSVANQLGISDAAYQQIKTFFGIQSVSLSLNSVHTTLTADGKAAVFAHLFQLHFVLHQLQQRQVFAPTSNPIMPRFFASSLLAITGMDNYTRPPQKHAFASSPLLSSTTHNRNKPGADCQTPSNTVPVQTIGDLYGYNNFWKSGLYGAGMTINLVEFDTFDKPDLVNFFACAHYMGKFVAMDVNNARPQNVDGESILDIEMIAGLAPAANIVDFEMDQSAAQSTNPFIDVLQAIITAYAKDANSASVLSISWGGPEDSYTLQSVAAIDQDLSILAKGEHMTIFVAAGDCAAFDDGTYGHLAVDFPGTDPNVVAVGGSMPGQGKTNGKPNEAVWSDNSDLSQCQNSWGGGGGNSVLFRRPAWQKANGIDNEYSHQMRQVPDVVAFAFPLAAYEGGQWLLSGGTSAATPIWAAGMALLNEATIKQFQGTYFVGTPLFYYVAQEAAILHHVQPYRDITQGTNLFFPATSNWDFASGLGSPNLLDFYKILAVFAQQH